METRTIKRSVSIQRASDDSPAVATGYAAVFYREDDPGSEYSVGNVHERIAPGAFDRALLEKQDVVAKFNHDSNNVLGRISNGTLRLEADTIGLMYSIDLPDTTVGRDLAFSLERGDVKGSSFAFNTVPGGVAREYRDGEMIVTLTDLDIGDVGPVANPAYESSSAQLRDSESFRQYAKDSEYVERDRRQRRARGLDVSEHVAQDVVS
jgi:HK97 family phage prohead protease